MNTVIDMGYMANDQRFIIRSSNGDYFSTSVGPDPDEWPTDYDGISQIHPFITWVRDRIKTVMEAENGGQNWRVGRIAEWTGGLLSGRSIYGYAFKIEQLNAGTPTGKEWCMFFSGLIENLTNEQIAEIAQVVGNVAGYSAYFVPWFHTSDGFVAMQYNSGGLSTSWDFDATLADTFNTANDFTPPNTNPYSQDDQFFPDDTVHSQLRGHITGEWNQNRSQDRWVFIFNHNIPFCGFYRAKHRSNFVREVVIMGDIVVPRVSTDTRKDGWFFYSIEARDNDVIQDGERLYAINPDTDSENSFQPAVLHNAYTTANQPRDDGTFDKDVVKVVNSNIDKGYLNPDLVAIQGPNGWMRDMLFESPEGACVKVTDELVFPWTTSDPIFPAGYPSVWFAPRIQDTVQ